MDNKKICFICCVNDDEFFNEAMIYVENLYVPEGYIIESLCIKESEYMTKSYNEAILASDAKYKVFLHQDVFIINKNFIYEIINIFTKDNEIGLIGMVGSKTIPTSGIWWESNSIFGKVYDSHNGKMELLQFQNPQEDYESVSCIDGLIMITQYDIPWREDIFTGWHFYDISQSVEFLKCGYKVVVPKQEEPWCIHDSGIANIKNGYGFYRDIFLREYNLYCDS
jgi:hypothetical protein